MRVLVVNAGSSSLKLTLLSCAEGGDDVAGTDTTIAARELDAPRAQVDPEALRKALDEGLGDADAVGHRIVHGGERFREAVAIDVEVERALRELVDLAPLHQPKSLAALEAVSEALPQLPAVACFDTAFHATMPPAAATYAIPREWRERWGLRRYGFHGLSHAWIARRAPQLLGHDAGGLRIVSCHLGAGASLCAIADGASRDTTMGFTPLEGLAMATRSGSVDPGMLLWLVQHEAVTADELADALEHRSGLLGLAGSADMREVLARAEAQGSATVEGASELAARAQLALDVYIHRLRSGIAAMAAALGGVDALAFTGGVGEHSAVVRERAAAGLAFLGVELDRERNLAAFGDAEIGADGAATRTLVIAAREDLEIARQVRTVLRKK
ncbi:MAG TPA: acetate/propionate family kinase [Solirubrobacteraceae bacterium]|jgi:acetate kinase|nr:acetate/propionate family kinase [Solirubrobacteraceae bacterium]